MIEEEEPPPPPPPQVVGNGVHPAGWRWWVTKGGEYFLLPEAFVVQLEIGSGQYGCVVSAVLSDAASGTSRLVAVKKIRHAFADPPVIPGLAPHVYQELHALALLRSEHKICRLLGIVEPPPLKGPDGEPSGEWVDCYVVLELVAMSLAHAIASLGSFSAEHVQYFAKQLCQAVAAVHATGMLHRDIKPENVLLTRSSALRLADFGLARELPAAPARLSMYVQTRYYRAPELLCGVAPATPTECAYGPGADVWSIGCVVAEALRGRGGVLFRGANAFDQLRPIVALLGAAPPAYVARVASADIRALIAAGPDPELRLQRIAAALPGGTPAAAVAFLGRVFRWEAGDRVTAAAAVEECEWLADGLDDDDGPDIPAGPPPPPPPPPGASIAEVRAAALALRHFLLANPSPPRPPEPPT